MFIGHFGLALGAKRVARPVSLAALFAACELADLLWPVLVIAGIERVDVRPGVTAMTPLDFVSYPYSHSLLMLCLWGLVLAALYMALARAGAAAGAVLTALVVSHWVLDVVTHRPDMPVTPWGDTRLGLGLWNSIPATLVVESIMFAAGLLWFLQAAPPATRGRRIGLWSLTVVMLVIYFGNTFGPAPPSSAAVAWSANGIWLFVLWAYFVDRPGRHNGETRSAR
jgi:membrane-bound metal-dependent hydrolase YbcI (DUF457 family)